MLQYSIQQETYFRDFNRFLIEFQPEIWKYVNLKTVAMAVHIYILP